MRHLNERGGDATQTLLMRLVQQTLVQNELLALTLDDVLFLHFPILPGP